MEQRCENHSRQGSDQDETGNAVMPNDGLRIILELRGNLFWFTIHGPNHFPLAAAPNVAFGGKADMGWCTAHVCF
jgi:hypothetical protein